MSHSNATDKSATPSNDQSTEQPAEESPRDVSSELSAFQRDILITIWAKTDAGQTVHGLAIKEELEEYYPEEIHHGRLYPNVDTLVDLGIVEKGEFDRRTNSYEVTEFGEDVIAARKEWIQSLPNRGGAE